MACFTLGVEVASLIIKASVGTGTLKTQNCQVSCVLSSTSKSKEWLQAASTH